jgi:hypothetical protein
MNAWRAPESICAAHLANERAQLALSGQLEQAARSGNPSAHFGWVASYQTEPQLTLTCAL